MDVHAHIHSPNHLPTPPHPFKSTLKKHFAKKRHDAALATSKCLTCGLASNGPVVGNYSVNGRQLRSRGRAGPLPKVRVCA